jgi:hypothetical protein
MIYLVWWKRTDVSEEHVSSIFRARLGDTFVIFYKIHVITLHRTAIFTAIHCATIRSLYVKASLHNKAV